MIEIKVRDNRERNRFELEVDGGIAFADYELKDGVIVFTHTEVSAGAGGARRRFGAYSGSAGAGSRKEIESCLALLLRYRFFQATSGICGSIESLMRLYPLLETAGAIMLWDELTRVKSIERLQREVEQPGQFRRVLGLWQLTSIGLGGLIGVGIFVLTGVVAATQAGPAVSLSFVIAGMASGAAALCYAEFAGMIPVAGSAYTYAYAVLGELVAWVIGWDLLLEYGLVVAVVSIGWSGYLQALLGQLGVTIPHLGDGRAGRPAPAMSWTFRRCWEALRSRGF